MVDRLVGKQHAVFEESASGGKLSQLCERKCMPCPFLLGLSFSSFVTMLASQFVVIPESSCGIARYLKEKIMEKLDLSEVKKLQRGQSLGPTAVAEFQERAEQWILLNELGLLVFGEGVAELLNAALAAPTDTGVPGNGVTG